MGRIDLGCAKTVGQALSNALRDWPGIEFAFLFGSVARGQAGPLSDVDVAIKIRPGLTDPRPLILHLVTALGSNRVDLVDFDRASPLLRQRILRDGIAVVVTDESALVRLRFRTQIEVLDTGPLRALWIKAFRERWQEGHGRGA